jgi:hypothetical protein
MLSSWLLLGQTCPALANPEGLPAQPDATPTTKQGTELCGLTPRLTPVTVAEKFGHAVFSDSAFTAKALNSLNHEGVKCTARAMNLLELQNGAVLFMPKNNVSVETRQGVAFIPKGAITWVVQVGDNVAIFDIHDANASSVKMTVNKEEVSLSPGTEALITNNNKADFESLSFNDQIAYRNLRSHEVSANSNDENAKVFLCDFSLATAIKNVPAINHLLKSSDPEEVKLAHTLLKNAVIFDTLTTGAGPYKLPQHKPTTAQRKNTQSADAGNEENHAI